MLAMGLLAFFGVVAALGGHPALSQAHNEIDLDVDAPSSVTMPDGALLHLSPSPASGVNTAVWDHHWNLLGGCSGTCDHRAMAWLLEGGSHPVTETLNFQSFGPNQTDSPIVTKTVTFNPPAWEVGLDMPDEVEMPDPIPATLSTQPKLASTHSVDLINADNNQYANLSCATGADPCSGDVNTGWLGALPAWRQAVPRRWLPPRRP